MRKLMERAEERIGRARSLLELAAPAPDLEPLLLQRARGQVRRGVRAAHRAVGLAALFP